ncbi:MAG: hypothetical protein F6J93_31530 [Oscillatoria sp. SIO1A7]|nr:hypothetical protein [Oscillatoria sp. SIO1A7]
MGCFAPGTLYQFENRYISIYLYCGSQIDVRLSRAKHPNTAVSFGAPRLSWGCYRPYAPWRDRLLHLLEKGYIGLLVIGGCSWLKTETGAKINPPRICVGSTPTQDRFSQA